MNVGIRLIFLWYGIIKRADIILIFQIIALRLLSSEVDVVSNKNYEILAQSRNFIRCIYFDSIFVALSICWSVLSPLRYGRGDILMIFELTFTNAQSDNHQYSRG